MSNKITESIIVRRPVAELFALWSNFENFPNFMKNIKEVKVTRPRFSHWKADGPVGTNFEWDAETTALEPNKRIAWNSLEGSTVKTSGQVTFNSLGANETELTVMMHYDPPAGKAGDVAAKLFENPKGRVVEDLKNFKAYAEGMPERSTAH